MNRHQFAIDIATGSQPIDIKALARGFADAVEHTEVEGRAPLGDAAVLLIGSFIAFQVHADVNSAAGYHRLLRSCFDNLHASPKAIQ